MADKIKTHSKNSSQDKPATKTAASKESAKQKKINQKPSGKQNTYIASGIDKQNYKTRKEKLSDYNFLKSNLRTKNGDYEIGTDAFSDGYSLKITIGAEAGLVFAGNVGTGVIIDNGYAMDVMDYGLAFTGEVGGKIYLNIEIYPGKNAEYVLNNNANNYEWGTDTVGLRDIKRFAIKAAEKALGASIEAIDIESGIIVDEYVIVGFSFTIGIGKTENLFPRLKKYFPDIQLGKPSQTVKGPLTRIGEKSAEQFERYMSQFHSQFYPR